MKAETAATLSLVLGGLGLLFFAIIFGPLAIIFGAIGMKSEEKGTYAKIGIILGVVDIILWVLVLILMTGMFDPGANIVNEQEGFGLVKPIEWSCEAKQGASDTVSAVFVNAAGEDITNVSVTANGKMGECDKTTVDVVDRFTCNITDIDCGSDSPGTQFETSLEVSYVSPEGTSRSSVGTIKGPAE